MKEQFELDNPEIKSIGWWDEPDFQTVCVGDCGITRIDCREQYCGEYSIYWLQVWKGARLIARYNAKNIDSIEYEE